MSPRLRIPAAVLTMSIGGLSALFVSEHYTEKAIIPTKGDVPTYGFGSTTKPDGSRVQLGDRTTPVAAVTRTLSYLEDAQKDVKDTLEGVVLTQGEFDVYMNWRYQYGIGAWRKSSMLRHLRAGNYIAACDALLLYKFSGGYDCSTPGNRVCAGVWTRQQERHRDCMAEQVP